jgi:hypothetical protein
MNFYPAVVIDEPQFPEFVHEGTDAGSRRADKRRGTSTASEAGKERNRIIQ